MSIKAQQNVPSQLTLHQPSLNTSSLSSTVILSPTLSMSSSLAIGRERSLLLLGYHKRTRVGLQIAIQRRLGQVLPAGWVKSWGAVEAMWPPNATGHEMIHCTDMLWTNNLTDQLSRPLLSSPRSRRRLQDDLTPLREGPPSSWPSSRSCAFCSKLEAQPLAPALT